MFFGDFFFLNNFELYYNDSRVSPTEEQKSMSKKKREKSAGAVINNTRMDPLEPWSTKDLANINQILHSK